MAQKISQVEDIALDGFKVVSGSMFAHFPRTNDPSCTLWCNSISFSKSAILSLNSCDSIMIRVNPNTKCLLISPAPSSDKDSISWRKSSSDVQSKKMDCKQFTEQLYKSWGFDLNYVYRSYGRLVTVDKKVMLLFEFADAEKWVFRTKEKDNENE